VLLEDLQALLRSKNKTNTHRSIDGSGISFSRRPSSCPMASWREKFVPIDHTRRKCKDFRTCLPMSTVR